VNCPAWNTDKPLNPALIIKDLQAHLYDEAPRILAGTAAPKQEEGTIPPLIAGINPDAIWACTTCRSCSEQCPVMIEHVDKIIDMRRHMVLNLNQFPPELKVTLKNLETKSNPWGISSAKRGAWAKKRDDVPDLKSNPNAEWLYFVGCAGAYDDRAKKVTEAVVKILNAAGVDFAIMGKKEKCSGDAARRMGHEYLFQEQATANIEQMNKAGVKKVIATCPHCFNSIKNEYPQLGGHFEVVHHTQLIWRLVREGKLDLKSAARMKITFHDSCYLGRYNDEYDAPREALKAVPGVEIVEMERSKQMGMCCGAGGARMFMEETIGTRVNQLRVEQAMETKPEAIVVSCPFCLTMVKDGLREKNIEGVETLDVAEVIANALVEPKIEEETPAAEPTAVPAAP
jgi:Fe-S oxidoreductase